MFQNYLLQGEKIITESKNGHAILTNFRIQYSNKQWGKAYASSILLKNISTIEISYKSNMLLLVLAAIFFIGVLISGSGLIQGVIISSILVLIFFLTKRHYITISSNGGAKINLLIKGMKKETISTFLNQIEQAIIDNISSKKLTKHITI